MDPIITNIQALCNRDFSNEFAARYADIVGKNLLRSVCCRMVRLLSALNTLQGERLPDDLDDSVFAQEEADEMAAAITLLREPSIARIFELESGKLTIRREISPEERREFADYCRRNAWRTQMRRKP